MKLELADSSCRWGVPILALIALLLLPVAAGGHPLGNFTINRYSRLELGADQVRVRYVVDMAEIPTFQERARIDLDRDGAIDAVERERYLAETLTALQSRLHLTVDGESQPLQPWEPQLEFLPGQGGLQTLRLSLWFTARLPRQAVWQVEYRDDNFAGRVGWQEIVVLPSSVRLLASSAPAQDLSDELRNYPQDMLQSPPAVDRAAVRFAPATTTLQEETPGIQPLTTTGPSIQGRGSDRFTQLIATPELSPGLIALAVLMALAWGAAHALTPGHGKTIVAAYLVGARATVRDALFLGATTTITHTAGVFLLGLLTLFASQYIVPEQLYPWLEAISGLLVIAVGVALLVRRLHWHSHDHVHPHVHEHNLCYHHDHHDHDHPHDHSHDQADHGHSHLPPSADGAPVTRHSLLALGVSGGLLPCPAALVVMLGAIALNRVGFGLLLIVAFSLGLAGALTAIGVLMVRAKTVLERMSAEGRWLSRIPLNRQLIRALPAVSALFIVLVGTGVTLTALVQAGLLHW